MTRRTVSFAIALLALSAAARGDDLFQLAAQTTSGTPVSRLVTGSSLLDLADNAVRTQGQFSVFENRDFQATLTYAGLRNAARVSVNAAGTSATLNLPPTGFTRTFTAANRDDLEEQIEEFLKKDGSKEWARFLKAVNQQTPLGVTDGNPHSTTAFLAEQTYRRFGPQGALAMPQPGVGGNDPAYGFRADVWGGSIQTDPGDGYYVAAALASAWKLGDMAALSLAVPFEYRSVEGSDTYNLGLELALPITILPHMPDAGRLPLQWQLAPFGVAAVAGSADQVAGGVILGGGLASLVVLRADNLTFGIANQIGFYEGTTITFGDYEFDTDVSQIMLKNGLFAMYSFSPGFAVDASITNSAFLKRSAIDNYWTPGVGAVIRFGPKSGLRLGYSVDLGPGYEAHSGNLLLYFAM